MLSISNYQGQLLVAHPSNPEDNLKQSVILIISHAKPVSLGLQINRPMKHVDLASVCRNIDVEYQGLDPLYHGGIIGVDKVHVVHSSDWAGLSTVRITPEISVTSDVSILAALALDQGPEYFRACSGYWSWTKNLLESQLGLPGTPRLTDYRWETVPSSIETVFGTDEEDQWIFAIDRAAKYQVDRWF